MVGFTGSGVERLRDVEVGGLGAWTLTALDLRCTSRSVRLAGNHAMTGTNATNPCKPKTEHLKHKFSKDPDLDV